MMNKQTLQQDAVYQRVRDKNKDKQQGFTDKQLQAITTIDENVAVSAGAGSGKTAVLTERFVYILDRYNAKKLDGEFFQEQDAGKKLDATNIVAITFTRKAAGEMKERIRGLLAANLMQKDFPGNSQLLTDEWQAHWELQMQRLERAQISTIHSLCTRILRENPVEAQLDPSFITAEEFDGDKFLDECLERFLRQELANGNEDLRQLAQLYGYNKVKNNINLLSGKLEDILAFGDLKKHYEDNLQELDGVRQKLCMHITQLAMNKKDDGTEFAKPSSAYGKKLVALNANLEAIKAGINASEPDYTLFKEYVMCMNKAYGVKEVMTIIKDDLYPRLCYEKADRIALKIIPLWQNIFTAFADYFAKSKAERDFLTFDDLESKALALLEAYPVVRQKYQERFKYIMVDEFQDTNDRQRELVYLLCGGDKDKLLGNKLFVVGDPKQSIYRFRGADVSVFRRVREDIGEKNNIVMQDNYRSVNKILSACNVVFEKLLGTDTKEDVYFEELAAHKYTEVLPELLLVPYDEKNDKAIGKRRLEGAVVAKRIKDLHAEGVPYSEMAILLRAMSNCATLAACLDDAKVPYTIVDGKGFYERQEVLDLLNLFTVLANRYRGIELAGVLRSPYFGLNDETLTKLFLSDENLWDALLAASTEIGTVALEDVSQKALLVRAANVLCELEDAAIYMALPELFVKVWDALRVPASLSLQVHGVNKLANVEKLRAEALAYSVSNDATLTMWLDYIADVRESGANATTANLDEEDAVQIMTMHKSKGLEFSTVFLPMLDAGVSNDTDSIKFLVDQKHQYGLGIKVYNDEGEELDTSVFADITTENKDKELQERKRQLYVAMTRAQDRLIMSGVLKESDKDAEKDLQDLNWLKQLYRVYTEQPGYVELPEVEKQEVLSAGVEEVQFGEQAVDEEALQPLKTYGALGQSYFTASSLQTYLHCKRQYYLRYVLELPEVEVAPAFEEVNAPLAAVTVGSIVHRALELYSNENLQAFVGNKEKAFAKAKEEFAPNQDASEAYELFNKYLESNLYKSIVGKKKLEERFVFALEPNMLFSGVIDCMVTEADGGVRIIDYKTGASPSDEHDVHTGYLYQLALYKEAVEKIYKRPVKSAELHFLRDLSVYPLDDKNYLEAVKETCREIAGMKSIEDFECDCATCNYQYICNQE